MPDHYVCACLSYDAVEVGVPQQHGAIVARWRVQVENQRVGTVLLPADVRHVVTNHRFLRCRVHALYILCGGRRRRGRGVRHAVEMVSWSVQSLVEFCFFTLNPNRGNTLTAWLSYSYTFSYLLRHLNSELFCLNFLKLIFAFASLCP